MKAYAYIDLRETRESEELLFAEIKARLESMPPRARRNYVKELKAIYPSRRIEPILGRPDVKELLKATTADGGMFYEREQFKQVNESKLVEYLRNGWTLLHALGNGDVIVKR